MRKITYETTKPPSSYVLAWFRAGYCAGLRAGQQMASTKDAKRKGKKR